MSAARPVDEAERRRLLLGMGAVVISGGLAACSAQPAAADFANPRKQQLVLAPLQASVDRITRITVCTRPFRQSGPRIEVEQLGTTTIVHNYGHGGSGWSLSWGSSAIAVDLAMHSGQRDIAVIGCGALGLTSATLLQRAGARVTIYAKELPPNVRSSFATGMWTPSSRICLEPFATPAFKTLWEKMARRSFDTYQTWLGLAGNPVEYFEFYNVADARPAIDRAAPVDPRPAFADLEGELLGDLEAKVEKFEPGSHSLGDRTLFGNRAMMFNINAYSRMLVSDFVANGGRIEIREFAAPTEFSSLPQKTLINATGYGARALFDDRSITPVRGQLARMAVQPGVDYGLYYKGALLVPRRDGFVFQVTGTSDYYGFGDDTTTANRTEAELAVNTIASLFPPV